jgi:hypothetical protein
MLATTKRASRPLQSTRTGCPSCGSSDGFAPYVGTKEEGYCFSCGKVTSSEYASPLLSNLERRERLAKWHSRSMHEAIAFRNGLSAYLLNTLGEPVRSHLQRWEVGTDAIGSCVFWHKDEAGELATAKTIAYDSATGKRLKGSSSPIGWNVDGKRVNVDSVYGLAVNVREDNSLVIESYAQKKGYELPLYGVQFLAESELAAPVLLVESEKTAVIASYFLPEFVVVACGGAKSLTAKKAAPLMGRVVYVLTDADEAGREGAEKACSILLTVGAKPRVDVEGVPLVDYLLEGAPKGYDLADYYLAEAASILAPTEHVATESAADEQQDTLQIGEIQQQEQAPAIVEELPAYPELTGGREAVKTAILRAFGKDEALLLETLHARIERARIAGGKTLVGLANMEGLVALRLAAAGWECYRTEGKAWTR